MGVNASPDTQGVPTVLLKTFIQVCPCLGICMQHEVGVALDLGLGFQISPSPNPNPRTNPNPGPHPNLYLVYV